MPCTCQFPRPPQAGRWGRSSTLLRCCCGNHSRDHARGREGWRGGGGGPGRGTHIADHDLLVPHFDGNGFSTRDADLAVVGEGDVLVEHAVVVDECLVEGPEIVPGYVVQDGHWVWGCARRRHDGSAESGAPGGGELAEVGATMRHRAAEFLRLSVSSRERIPPASVRLAPVGNL